VLSVRFIYIRVWGLPFLMLTQLFGSFFIVTNRSRLLVFGSLVATVTNILFDYLLIFGKGGLPAMGFTGAAVASVISEVCYCIAMVGLFIYHRKREGWNVFKYLRFDSELSKKSLTVAAPLIVQFMFSIGGWLVFFIFIEHLGSRELAASQVLRNVFGIAGLGTWALATTCNTMVSNVIGQGRQRDVGKVIRKICLLSFSYAVVLCSILLLFSHQFLSIYSSDAALIDFAVPSLRVIVVAMLIMSLSTVTFNGVVGTGNTLVNLTIEITCVGSYLVYCYFMIFRRHSPLYICWGSEFIYWSTLLITSLLYLKSGRWKGKSI
jgi:MATE family multidrug resistance protein